MTVRRGRRSPRTPPMDSIETWASVHAANDRPTADALPWRSRIANATAIGARYVPTYEIARLANSNLKFLVTPLLRPAGESAIRLPQRYRGAVHAHVLAGVRDLLLSIGDELLLGRAAEDELRVVVQLESQVGKMPLRVVGDAEVDERQPLGLAPLDLVDRLLPDVEVELRRRRGRDDVHAREDPHACGVAGVQRAVVVEVRDVVRRMARRGEAVEAEHPVADDVHVRLGKRCELAPQRVERVAVQPPRAALEPGGIQEVRRADLRHVDLQRRMLAHERSGRARVVEVDVAEH